MHQCVQPIVKRLCLYFWPHMGGCEENDYSMSFFFELHPLQYMFNSEAMSCSDVARILLMGWGANFRKRKPDNRIASFHPASFAQMFKLTFRPDVVCFLFGRAFAE